MKSTLKRSEVETSSTPSAPLGTPVSPVSVDPLYTIFEQHLFTFIDPDLDRRSFAEKIASEYITYLRRKNITVPRNMEQPIIEELSLQIKTMLVKKIYGCLTIEEFRRGAAPSVRRRARSRYAKLKRD